MRTRELNQRKTNSSLPSTPTESPLDSLTFWPLSWPTFEKILTWYQASCKRKKYIFFTEENTRNILLKDLSFFIFYSGIKTSQVTKHHLKRTKNKNESKLQFALNRKKNQLSSLIFLSYSFFLFQPTLLSLSDFEPPTPSSSLFSSFITWDSV